MLLGAHKVKKRRPSDDVDFDETVLFDVATGEKSVNDPDDDDLDWDYIPPPEMDYEWEEDETKTEDLLQEFLNRRDELKNVKNVSKYDSTSLSKGTNYAIIPGYPHLGPGNPIYPVSFNDIDDLARKHDIAYSKAKNYKDVQEADEQFLQDMNGIDNKTVGRWFVKQIGIGGISVKYALERKLGVLYPFVKNNPTKYGINTQEIPTVIEKFGPRNISKPGQTFLNKVFSLILPKKKNTELNDNSIGIDGAARDVQINLHESYRFHNARNQQEKINYIFNTFEKDVQTYYDNLLNKYAYTTDKIQKDYVRNKLSNFDEDYENYFMSWTDKPSFDKQNKDNILYRAYFALSKKEEKRDKVLAHKIKYQVLSKYKDIDTVNNYVSLNSGQRENVTFQDLNTPRDKRGVTNADIKATGTCNCVSFSFSLDCALLM